VRIFLLLFLFFARDAAAEELGPLSIYIKKHPAYLTNSNNVEYIANRCGALLTILAARTKEAGQTKEITKLSNEYDRIGNVYTLVGIAFSKSPKSSKKNYAELHKSFHTYYSNLILKNWKSGNMFNGLIDQDFATCAAHQSFYLQLSKNLK